MRGLLTLGFASQSRSPTPRNGFEPWVPGPARRLGARRPGVAARAAPCRPRMPPPPGRTSQAGAGRT